MIDPLDYVDYGHWTPPLKVAQGAPMAWSGHVAIRQRGIDPFLLGKWYKGLHDRRECRNILVQRSLIIRSPETAGAEQRGSRSNADKAETVEAWGGSHPDDGRRRERLR